MAIYPESSVVRIFNARDCIVGTGLQVSETSVLTCAHVIAEALGISAETTTIPEQRVNLDFPLAKTKLKISARIIYWQPVQADGFGDIAILQLIDSAPPGTSSARLVIANDLANHTFQAFGFPPGEDQGVWASGKVLRPVATRWVQLEGTTVTGHRIQRGFSGGAVWDDQLNGVVGIVVAEDRDPTLKTAYMIPTPVLLEASPLLLQQSILPCPYRGLQTFMGEDAHLFFGREENIEQLTEVFHRQSAVIVAGPSGSGKSSLVFAGLLPRLQHEGVYQLASLRPGDRPFQALAAALVPLLEPKLLETDLLHETSKMADLLIKDELRLLDVVERLLKKNRAPLVIVVDQLEELFAHCEEKATRQKFLASLLDVIEAMRSSNQLVTDTQYVSIVFTLRSDFLEQALSQDYRRFAYTVEATLFLLTPMTNEQLHDVIEKPASEVGVTFAPGLLERILEDFEGEAGALPLLEFALTLLWEQQQQRQITHASFEAIKKIKGALTNYANQVYDSLGKEEKSIARALLKKMVWISEEMADTRYRVTKNDLGEAEWLMIRKLADRRLIITTRNDEGHECAEIVHETLIQNWQLLRDWIKDDRDFLRWKQNLRVPLEHWQENIYDKEALLRGSLLGEAEEWFSQRHQEFSPEARNFICCSILHNESYETAERWQRRYGILDDTLGYYELYRDLRSDENCLDCITFISYLPEDTEEEEKIYERLLQFALDDQKANIRCHAIRAICIRGRLSQFIQALASQEFTVEQNEHLNEDLATLCNLPTISRPLQLTLEAAGHHRVLKAAHIEFFRLYAFFFALLGIFTFLTGFFWTSFLEAVIPSMQALSLFSTGDHHVVIGFTLKTSVVILLCLYIYIKTVIFREEQVQFKQYFNVVALFTFISIPPEISVMSPFQTLPFSQVDANFLILLLFGVLRLCSEFVELLLIGYALHFFLLAQGQLWKSALLVIPAILFESFFQLLIPRYLSALLTSTVRLPESLLLHNLVPILANILQSRDTFWHLSLSLFSMSILLTTAIGGCFLGLRLGARLGRLLSKRLRVRAIQLFYPGKLGIYGERLRNRMLGLNSLENPEPDEEFDLGDVCDGEDDNYTSNESELFNDFDQLPEQELASYPVPKLSLYADSSSIQTILRSSILLFMTIVLLTVFIGTIYWQLEPPRFIITGKDPNSGIKLLAWSSDGRYIATLDTGGNPAIWDLNAPNAVSTIHFPANQHYTDALSWSPNSKLLAVATTDGYVVVLDPSAQRILHTYPFVANAVTRPASSVLAWAPHIGAQLATTGMSGGDTTTVTGLTWSPDGSQIAASDSGGVVEIWNIAKGTIYLPYYQPGKAALNVSWSPDGKFLAFIASGHFQLVPNPTTPLAKTTPITMNSCKRQNTLVHALSWAPDSRSLALEISGPDLTNNLDHIIICNLVSGKIQNDFTCPYKSPDQGATILLAWAPNARSIAVAAGGRNIYTWDVTSGGDMYIFAGGLDLAPTPPVVALAWSPDSKRLISSNASDPVRFWDVPAF